MVLKADIINQSQHDFPLIWPRLDLKVLPNTAFQTATTGNKYKFSDIPYNVFKQLRFHYCFLSFILYMILRKKSLDEMFIRPYTEFWYSDPLDYVLEETLESPLDSKEIKPVNPKGNQPWISIRRTDAETPILTWRANSWKRPWYWERLKAKEEMVR